MTRELIQTYCETGSTPLPDFFYEIERNTHLKTLSPQMLSGAWQGRLLALLSQMIAPARILEIGTFTGFSALCLAQGLTQEGLLHTIEVNDELAPLIRQHIEWAGMSDKIRLHLGDAADVIPHLDEIFDLVFLDAGKLDYPIHFELAWNKLRPGGILIADNVLWDNRVPNFDDHDATVEVLRKFNRRVVDDPQVEMILLPVRDGLMLARKRA